MSEIVKSPQFGHKSPVEDEEKINKPEQPKSDELNNNNSNEHVVIYRTTSTQNPNKNDSFDIIELPQTSKDEMNGNLTDPITEILVPVSFN